MYFNKWIQAALSLAVIVTGAMAGFDWTTVFSAETSAKIATAIGVIKLITNALAPASNKTVVATGGTLVTHADAAKV